MEKLLKVREVAERCAVSTRHVRDLVNEGKLTATRVGAAIRVKPSALEAYLAQGETIGQAEEGAKAAA